MSVTMQTLKAATRRLVKACGGQESCALIDGIGNERHQHFSEVGLPAHPTKYLRLDQVAILEADCGQPEVTRELARASGHILVPRPRAMAADVPDIALMSIAKEHAELLATGLQALADKTLTAAEIDAMRVHCERVIEATAQLNENLRSMREACQ